MSDAHRIQYFVVVSFSALLVSAAGCSQQEAGVVETVSHMVYFDHATRSPVVAEIDTQFPARNPETGQRTLMPALYCASCENWFPAPPLDEINRTPGATSCPACDAHMTVDGPMPK